MVQTHMKATFILPLHLGGRHQCHFHLARKSAPGNQIVWASEGYLRRALFSSVSSYGLQSRVMSPPCFFQTSRWNLFQKEHNFLCLWISYKNLAMVTTMLLMVAQNLAKNTTKPRISLKWNVFLHAFRYHEICNNMQNKYWW